MNVKPVKPLTRVPPTRWPKLLVETQQWQMARQMDYPSNRLAIRMVERMYDARPYSTVVEPTEAVLWPVWRQVVLTNMAPWQSDDYFERVATLLSVSPMFHETLALASHPFIQNLPRGA